MHKKQTKCLHDDTAEFPSWRLSVALAQLIHGSTWRFPSSVRLSKKTPKNNLPDWLNSAELQLVLCWSDNFCIVLMSSSPGPENFRLGCFLLAALVCFHPSHMRAPSWSALSSGTGIHHVEFILSPLPRKRSVSNGLFYFNSSFVWLVLSSWKSPLRQSESLFVFLTHRLLSPEVKAGGESRLGCCIWSGRVWISS